MKEGEWGNVSLINGGYADNKVALLGLKVSLKPKWLTYWKYPGDAGVPMSIKLNAAGADNWFFLHPAPRRFVEDPSLNLEAYGYADTVIFPIIIEHNQQEIIKGKITAAFITCSDLCIPQNVEADFEIDRAANPDPLEVSLIRAAIAKVPSSEGDIKFADISIDRENSVLEVSVITKKKLLNPDVIIFKPANMKFPKPEVMSGGGPERTNFEFHFMSNAGNSEFKNEDIGLLLVDDNGVAVIRGDESAKITLSDNSDSTQPKAVSRTLIGFMFFAFLGGIILNLMPCVLPVLSLKALSLLKHAGGEKSETRTTFLWSACGIITSFIVMALILIGLKSSGLAFGWGIQFQQPAFIIFLILICSLFALNLWGVFEIKLPAFLGGSIDNALNDTAHSRAGSFLTGAFAVLLATPCTAPFLGTAIGFALASSSLHIFLIFTSIGFGLALPYIAIGLVPSIALLLPKPGAWMIKLKKFFAIIMAITAAWLLWVLWVQIGQHENVTAAENSHWQVFSEIKLEESLANGRTVLVDVTADWCLTCKFNKLRVLDDEEIQSMLKEKRVVLLRADYTNRDEEIRLFLEKHGRYGIPFNAIFTPSDRDGKILPELLTKDVVIEEFDKYNR